jgi:DNA-binding NtrC family response regulator/Tfp pilus assembly protein PilF
VPSFDPRRIADLEERLATPPAAGGETVPELEMLADIYLQADSYLPALEVIQRLLGLPQADSLSTSRRAALEAKAIECRLAQGDSAAALAHCREVLAREHEIEAPGVRALLHLRAADALFQLARFDECREHAEEALALADKSSDVAVSALALNCLGRVAYREGDLMRARDFYEQALVLHRRLGDEIRVASCRNNLGLIHKNLCEWDSAIAHFRGALECYRRLGRFADTGPPLINMGVVYQKRGDWDRALDFYQQADRVFLHVGDQTGMVRVAIGLGNIARLQRRFIEAETALLGALERARAHDSRREEVLALEFLGELDYDRGRAEIALRRYDEALVLAERVAPEGDLVVEIERRRAEALCALGRLDDAGLACDRASRLARLSDDRLEHAVAHRVSGDVAWGKGHQSDAVQLWTIAASLLSECHERYELGRTLLSLARASQDPREARRYLYRASALFSELMANHWLDQAESELHRFLSDARPAERPVSPLGRRLRAPGLVACSLPMQRAEALARRAAGTDLSVLITGETGTGKELIARTIHTLSTRSRGPFLAINCGALRADLALSQLFGHRKGAFTGAHAEGVGLVHAANGGTLFLDEVGDLPSDVQVTLLRFLESGEFLRLGETQVQRADVRVLAATNRELRDAVERGAFRRDLLFRLNEVEITLPALRDRQEDIVPLARHFLSFYAGLEGPKLSRDAEAVLGSYSWPGNVRELENVMRRLAALLAGTAIVDSESLLPFLGGASTPMGQTLDSSIDERGRILAALDEVGGNKSRLAKMLGVSRKTLYARIKKLNISLG